MHWELSSLPLLIEISDEEIKLHFDNDSNPDYIITFKQIPVYMQAVECRVKLFTEAPGKVFEDESLDEFIRVPLLFRSSMPYFTKKSVFKVFRLQNRK